MLHQVTKGDALRLRRLLAVRNDALDISVLLLAALGVPVLAVDLARALQIGWLWAMPVHIAVICAFWVVLVFRRRLSFSVKASVVLGLVLALAITVLATSGLSSEGSLLLLVFALLATLLFGTRAGSVALGIAFAVSCAFVAVVGAHWLTFAVDFKALNLALSNWLLLPFVVLFGSGALIAAGGKVYGALIQALGEAEERAEALRTSEAMVRTSEGLFRSLFESAPIGVALLNLDGQVQMVNSSLRHLFGLSEDEPPGATFARLLDPEGTAANRLDFQGLVSGVRDSYAGEQRYLRKDGRTAWCQVAAAMARDQEGAPLHVIVTALDVSEQHEAAEQLRQSEDRYRRIVETTHEGIWQVDATGRTTFVNARMAEMVGYGPAEMLGRFPWEFVAESDRLAALERQRRREQGQHDVADNCYVRKDGSTLWTRAQAFPVFDERGANAGALAMLADITEQRAAEQARAWLAAIVESHPASIVGASLEGVIESWNEGAERLYGFSAAEAIGQPVTQFMPAVRADEVAGVRDLAMQGRVVAQMETVRRHKDGRLLDVEITVSPIKDRDGLIMGVASFAQDIGGRKRTEAELAMHREHLEELVTERTAALAVAKEQAETANRAKSMFLANMSHELRTPMNAIIGFAEILEALVGEPKQRSYLTRIQASGNALLTLINDILDLSKIEAGKLALHYGPVSLQRLLDEIGQLFSHKLEEKGLELRLDLAADLPATVLLDEARLRQVLLNLVGNAVKFAQAGTVTVRAWSQAGDDGERSTTSILLSVCDTGVGMPQDQLSRIFEPFEQLENPSARSSGGAGLGLAIVRNLVAAMSGEISVESELGRGSTFTVVLTDVEVPAGEAEPMRMNGTERFDFTAVHFAHATVLVVDDVDYNRDLIRGFYNGYDLEVVEAQNGLEALDKAAHLRPDLILLDLKMPVMDGYTAAARLKADEALEHVPVIAFTASVLKQDEERISRLCDGYLRKPVRRAELVRATMAWLPHTVLVQPFGQAPTPGGSSADGAQRIAKLPAELVRALRRAIEMADIGAIQRLIERIGQDDSALAHILTVHADRFDYDALRAVLGCAGTGDA